MTEKRHVLVCTDKRGVFMGEFESFDGNEIVLKDAQMCVLWARSVKGVVGLAHHGPNESCRITSPAPKMTLFGVTAIMDMTDDAVQAWKDEPWGSG